VKIDPKVAFARCETLMLDMDGTVLDLAYDNYMWQQHVPRLYAAENGLEPEAARDALYAKFKSMQGSLDWYCLDHWSNELGLDIAKLHRDENHRIGYLPGAENFLKTVRELDIRVILVTNSHGDTLTIKDEVTGVTEYFDEVYTSHRFGHAKESQEFWHALAKEEDFDPKTTMFVDDTARVLRSAAEYGISMLLQVTHPDTTTGPREDSEFAGVTGVRELL
jgi:putative hydrolase of the HAD superfamily